MYFKIVCFQPHKNKKYVFRAFYKGKPVTGPITSERNEMPVFLKKSENYVEDAIHRGEIPSYSEVKNKILDYRTHK